MKISDVENNKIIAIIRNVYGLKLLRLSEALSEGGIKAAEVAFGADAGKTIDAVAELKEFCGPNMFIGAGTVLNGENVRRAAKAGARFIISPNVSKEVIYATRDCGLLSVAGAMTPTEIIEAHSYGADFIKIFPADVLGTAYIRAVKAPFPDLKFIAASGITESNIGEYLAAGYSAAGVSGRLADLKLIEKGDFQVITQRAAAYVKAAKNA